MKKTFHVFLALSFVLPATIQSPEAAEVNDASTYLDQFVDRSVDPGEDFFRFSVGKWIQNNPIPSNENSWGIARVVYEETYQRVLKINEEASADPNATKGTNAQKIGDFWYTAMDTKTIEEQGIAPLKEEFDRIDAVHDRQSLLDTIARLKYIGVAALFSPAIFQDEKNSEKFALHLYQGGIGLPERDYYFRNR